MKICHLVLCGLLFLVIATSGCVSSDLQPVGGNINTLSIRITESKNYSINIENSGGISEKKFSNLQVQLIDDMNIVSTQEIKINKTELGKGEQAQIKLFLLGKKKGKNDATLRITYSGGAKDITIPIEVSGPNLIISLKEQTSFGGELKVYTNQSNGFTIHIENKDGILYQHGKVKISPDYGWVNLQGAPGYATKKENNDLIIDTQIPASIDIPFILIPDPQGRHVGFGLKISLLWSSSGDIWDPINENSMKLTTD